MGSKTKLGTAEVEVKVLKARFFYDKELVKPAYDLRNSFLKPVGWLSFIQTGKCKKHSTTLKKLKLPFAIVQI